MSEEFNFRSALAMRIAGVDRQKFNEAVAADFYPCAPKEMEGTSRVFREHELVGLWVFGWLLRAGVVPRVAGPLACEFMRQAENNPQDDRIVYLQSQTGISHFFAGSNFDIDLARGAKKVRKDTGEEEVHHYAGLSPVAFTIDFYVSTIRQMVAREIENQKRTFGEDDE